MKNEPRAREILEGVLDDVFGADAQPDAPRTTLGELLELVPPQILEHDIMPLLNSGLSDREVRQRLMPILNRFKDDLEAGGVIPDYLAWALIYARQQQRGPM